MPGSDEALALGCECPLYEDDPLKRTPGRGFIVHERCPVHVIDEDHAAAGAGAEDERRSLVYWCARANLAESRADLLEHEIRRLRPVLNAAHLLLTVTIKSQTPGWDRASFLDFQFIANQLDVVLFEAVLG